MTPQGTLGETPKRCQRRQRSALNEKTDHPNPSTFCCEAVVDRDGAS
jgi:hypothetical protein